MLQKIEENVTDLYFFNNSSSDLNEILQVFEEYTINMWGKEPMSQFIYKYIYAKHL